MFELCYDYLKPFVFHLFTFEVFMEWNNLTFFWFGFVRVFFQTKWFFFFLFVLVSEHIEQFMGPGYLHTREGIVFSRVFLPSKLHFSWILQQQITLSSDFALACPGHQVCTPFRIHLSHANLFGNYRRVESCPGSQAPLLTCEHNYVACWCHWPQQTKKGPSARSLS